MDEGRIWRASGSQQDKEPVAKHLHASKTGEIPAFSIVLCTF